MSATTTLAPPHSTLAQTPPPGLDLLTAERLTVPQAAARIGVSISSVWRALRGAYPVRLDSMYVGGRRYVLACDLRRWLEEMRPDADGASDGDDRPDPAPPPGRRVSVSKGGGKFRRSEGADASPGNPPRQGAAP
jgi:hypothetical protein